MDTQWHKGIFTKGIVLRILVINEQNCVSGKSDCYKVLVTYLF